MAKRRNVPNSVVHKKKKNKKNAETERKRKKKKVVERKREGGWKRRGKKREASPMTSHTDAVVDQWWRKGEVERLSVMSLTTAGAAGVGTHEKGYNRKKRRVGVSGTREGVEYKHRYS